MRTSAATSSMLPLYFACLSLKDSIWFFYFRWLLSVFLLHLQVTWWCDLSDLDAPHNSAFRANANFARFTVKLNEYVMSFTNVLFFWFEIRIFIRTTMSFQDIPQSLMCKVGWQVVDVIVGTLGYYSTVRAAQTSPGLLSQPPLETRLTESMLACEKFWWIGLSKLVLAEGAFQFFLDCI